MEKDSSQNTNIFVSNIYNSEMNNSKENNIKLKNKNIVFIEGNISSGKSTVIKQLESSGHTVFEEAVSVLTDDYVDNNGNNILALFYGDMKRYAFELQMVSMNARWGVIKKGLKLLNETSTELVIIERSLLTDKHSFAVNLYNTGKMTSMQWQIYNNHLSTHIEDTKSHFEGINITYLYLRVSPEICLDRKYERGRTEESTLELDYLKELHETYDKWLNNNDELFPAIKIINANESLDKVVGNVKKVLDDLNK